MPTDTPSNPPETTLTLFSISWDKDHSSFAATANYWGAALILVCVLLPILARVVLTKGFKNFELDEAEIGLGKGKLKFKPSVTDKQVAYAIWVELGTRKIGLPIDFENDVIEEIYDSWHTYFSVTRDLIKGIPASKVQSEGTQAIIKLSMKVLNEGLRPHLTRWQARFRRWYARELKKYDEAAASTTVIDPQEIQKKFPQYDELKKDMELVNKNLMSYRKKMADLIWRIND